MDVSLERLIGGFARGVTGLLGFAANLEAQGKDEYAEQGEITGKTENGKEIKGIYGFRVKVGLPVRSRETKAGLNPEDFSGQKKLFGKGGSASGGKICY
ncbi:MAG: hypothetical protein AAB975_04985 [Patescibacteria group bacterium]